MKALLLIIAFYSSQLVFSQNQQEVVSISDTIIIYNKSSNLSSPIHKALPNEVLLTNEFDNVEGEWLKVDFSKSKVSKSKSGKEDFFQSGFIKKSQVIFLDSLSQTKDIEISFQMIKTDTIKTFPYDSLNYGITLLNYAFETKKMFVHWNGNKKTVNHYYHNDLYNISFKETILSSLQSDKFKTYKRGSTYFIKHNCSDGAEYYEITWVIKNGEIIQRLIESI